MSEQVLRRSGRNAGKKETLPPAPAAAPQTKKRASAEPKKPAPKKAKVKTVVAKNDEVPASSSKGATASTASTTGAAAAKSARTAAAKAGKVKKGEAVVESATNTGNATTTTAVAAAALGDGDALPKDLPEVQVHDGVKTSLNALLEKAQKGIIIFAYPKAQTPGCTTQACLFRDNFAAFSKAGYSVFGLSGDSPSVNEKFKTKQNLSFSLLCDPTFELHERFGIKKQPKGTIRSIIVIEKTDDDVGKVVKKAPASPQVSLSIAQQVAGIADGGAGAATTTAAAAVAAAGSGSAGAAGATEKVVEGNKALEATSAVDAAA